MDFNQEQELICRKYKTSFLETALGLKVGISLNTKSGLQPLNGLRVAPIGDTSGWYIWAGEELSEDPDFFVSVHAIHLAEYCPDLMKYLGLPPGWRFLIAPDYEDVWEDNHLLK